MKFLGSAGLPLRYWTDAGTCPDSNNGAENLAENYTKVNNLFVNAGAASSVFASGDDVKYWTSTEAYEAKAAWDVQFDSTYGVIITENRKAAKTYRVRAFFAF